MVREIVRMDAAIERATEEFSQSVRDGLAGRRQSILDLDELRRRQLYQHGLERALDLLEQERTKRHQQLTFERGKLVETMKHRKAIDKLREKRWTAHVEQLRREEQKATDETAGTGSRRLQVEDAGACGP